MGKSITNKVLNSLPKGARDTMDLVSKLNNKIPRMAINHNLIFSIDDTTMHVSEGIKEKQVANSQQMCIWK